MPDLGGWPRLALVEAARFAWTAAVGLGRSEGRSAEEAAASVLDAGEATIGEAGADGRARGTASVGTEAAAAGSFTRCSLPSCAEGWFRPPARVAMAPVIAPARSTVAAKNDHRKLRAGGGRHQGRRSRLRRCWLASAARAHRQGQRERACQREHSDEPSAHARRHLPDETGADAGTTATAGLGEAACVAVAELDVGAEVSGRGQALSRLLHPNWTLGR